MMPLDEFKDLIRRMREKQKTYFRTRDAAVLRECKDLERRVDDELDARFHTPALFEDDA